MNLSSTGGWEIWKEFNDEVEIPSGEQMLRIKCASGSWNLDYFDLSLLEAYPVNHPSDVTNHNLQSNLTVYPNPASNILTIAGIKDETSKIAIYNSYGQLVDIKILENGACNVSDLKAGIYFIKISDVNRHELIKFIKE